MPPRKPKKTTDLQAPQDPVKRIKRAKYKNVKTIVDGIKFDSGKEAARWVQLRQEEADGAVQNLQRQVRFRCEVKGQLITTYIADFTYYRRGELIVEDCKGIILPIFKLKQKLVRACFGLDVKIV